MRKISYAEYRFLPEVIDHAIWFYLRFTLSFLDVEDLLAERGIAVSYETVRRRVNHFGPMMIAAQLRTRLSISGDGELGTATASAEILWRARPLHEASGLLSRDGSSSSREICLLKISTKLLFSNFWLHHSHRARMASQRSRGVRRALGRVSFGEAALSEPLLGAPSEQNRNPLYLPRLNPRRGSQRRVGHLREAKTNSPMCSPKFNLAHRLTVSKGAFRPRSRYEAGRASQGQRRVHQGGWRLGGPF
jgi:hypothetical protein